MDDGVPQAPVYCALRAGNESGCFVLVEVAAGCLLLMGCAGM